MRYETGELLGEGGMGEVYRAFDPQLQRPVALKFLRREEPRQIERLLREARAQAKVEHPGICKVYEVGEHDGRHFIAMQLVEGESLDKLAPRLSLEQRVVLLREVAVAVHAAHRAGLVHRDLKPQNVLVETREGQLVPYVTDFGIVRDAEAKSLTRTGEALGTPPYMSPEQVRGELQSLDRRSDVWSLGAVLFELVAGRPPFAGGSAVQTLFQIVNTDAPLLRKLAPRAPRDLEVIAAHCLEKEPQRRYQSARALADDLTRWLDGKPIEASAPGLARRLWERARRNKLAAAVLVAGPVAALSFTLVFWRARAQAERQSQLAQQFSREAAAIESTLRIAHLLPLHDLRPERDQVRERMRSVEAALPRLGAIAEGPGRTALGRGALALHDLPAARAHLERAWAAGYRPPEVALALGQTLGEQYRAALDEAVSRESETARAERRKAAERDLRDPALTFLRAGRGAAAETPAFVEALLALCESRYQDAIARAEAAQRESPSLYEAARVAGDAWTRMAFDAREKGDLPAAAGFAARAAGAYRQGAEIGRSDDVTYAGECRRWQLIMNLHGDRGEPVDESAAAAIAACDQALAVNPDSVTAFNQKAWIYWYQADRQGMRGLDLRPALARSIEMSREALKRDPENLAAHLAVANAWFVQAEKWDRHYGIDPRPSIGHAIESFERSIAVRPTVGALANLCSAHAMIGGYEKEHGGDPLPHWERAVASCHRVTGLDPRVAYPFQVAGWILGNRAEWELSRGIDPRAAVGSAVEENEKAIALQPSAAAAHMQAGWAIATRAAWERLQGLDCRAAIDDSLKRYRQSVALKPTQPYVYDNIADSYRLLGLYQLEHALDPSASLRLAREALETGFKLDNKLAFTQLKRAQVELLAARQAFAGPGAAPLFQAALEAAARGAELSPDTPELALAEAQIRRWQAEWHLGRGERAAADVERGLSAATRTLGLNPGLAEAVAVRGTLLRLESRAEPSRERSAALAGEAQATLRKAHEMNPLLVRDYPP